MSKYDFALDLEADNSLKWINDCLTDYSIILEFGPANGRLTKHLAEKRHCTVDIVEIDMEAGEQAAKYARNSLIGTEEGDIEKFIWVERFEDNKYDYIIFADVLEHLYRPDLVLEKCKKILSKTGKIVFSVPNVAYNGLILNLLRDRFEYTPIGLLDDTHIRFFTYYSIIELVKKLNMHIVFQVGSQSEVGTNEVTGRYEYFSDYNSDIIKSHLYGSVYQFIIAIQLAPGDVIDKLAPISDRIQESFKNYVNPNVLLEEESKLLEETNKLLEEKSTSLEETNRLLEEKSKLLKEVLHSRSWRITEPLRALKRLIFSSVHKEVTVPSSDRKEGIDFSDPLLFQKYHLEDVQSLERYQRWLKEEAAKEVCYKDLPYRPKFSFVIPVYNTVTWQLEDCIQSVLAQTYDNYELILVDDCSSWDNVRPVLHSFEKNEKVTVIYRKENGHISKATNDGINAASGEFIVFMDCDDLVEKDALYWFAEKLNENRELDFIYSDEDKITEDSKIRHMPFFKPEWSPDLFMSMMYTNHLGVYRAEIVKQIGGLRTEFNGSQDYDMTLRFMEVSDNTRVGHIPKILYHWREREESAAFSANAKDYAVVAGGKAKEDCFKRRGITARIEEIPEILQYRVVYEVTGRPLVSIIIPSKDNPAMLKQCIMSILRVTTYNNYEIIVVDNGSNEKNKNEIETFLLKYSCKYVYEAQDFNFSRMCNCGVTYANGEFILFLNDDVEVFQPNWLDRMLGQAMQKHTGAVGAKLYYPETTFIQHAGVINIKPGPSHAFLKEDDNKTLYFNWNRVDCNFLAVTGACLLVKKEIFNEVNGFNENLAVAYNDVDLCFKLYEKGYYNVLRNDVTAYHHESFSRGIDTLSEDKLSRLNKERELLYTLHPLFRGYDPFYNPNFGDNVYFMLVDDVVKPEAEKTAKDVKYYIKRIIVLGIKTVQSFKEYGAVYTTKKIKKKISKFVK